MAGSTAGARKISPMVPVQVEQAVANTEVEMTGIVEVAEARVNVDVGITTEAAGVAEEEEEEAKIKLVAVAELETTNQATDIVDADVETDFVDTDLETEFLDTDLETTTEAAEQLPYGGPFRSAECKREMKELMKMECVIDGHTEHCQTFEIEVETIVDEEICHNITTVVCQAPETRIKQELVGSGEQAETTTTVPVADTESMDTTTVKTIRPMRFVLGRSLGCTEKVSEVCYSSQRVEKATRPKDFCWVS